jgi:hypothetical protein
LGGGNGRKFDGIGVDDDGGVPVGDGNGDGDGNGGDGDRDGGGSGISDETLLPGSDRSMGDREGSDFFFVCPLPVFDLLFFRQTFGSSSPVE